jgi:23S rRNA (adenine2503-C2)-methyltransferase
MAMEQGDSFEDMTNISIETRAMLESNFVINHKGGYDATPEDGTVKNAVRLHDGLVVESVLIPTTPGQQPVCRAKWVAV